MKNLLFGLGLLAIVFASCGDGTPENLDYKTELRIKAVYDGQPLVMFEEYDYEDTELFFSRLDLFMNNIQLNDADGGSIPLSDIEFVDFTENQKTLEDANEGISFTYNIEKPAADLASISFGVGVDAATNTSLPTDYSSDNPLSQTGYYWENWDSFIFMKLQGQYDENADGEFALQFLFHTGTDDQHRTFNLPVTSEFDTEGNAVIELEIDYKKMYEVGSGYYNIAENPVNHSPMNPVPMLMLSNNLSNALTVK